MLENTTRFANHNEPIEALKDSTSTHYIWGLIDLQALDVAYEP